MEVFLPYLLRKLRQTDLGNLNVNSQIHITSLSSIRPKRKLCNLDEKRRKEVYTNEGKKKLCQKTCQ